MSKFNKIFIFFIIAIILMVWGFLQFLQTEKFSSFLVSHVNKINNDYPVNISFQKIKIKIFPVETIFLQPKIEGTDFIFKGESIQTKVNIYSLFTDDIKLEDFVINQGDLTLKKLVFDGKEDVDFNKYYQKLQVLGKLSSFLIEKYSFNNLKISGPSINAFLPYLSVSFADEGIGLRTSLILDYAYLANIKIDVDFILNKSLVVNKLNATLDENFAKLTGKIENGLQLDLLVDSQIDLTLINKFTKRDDIGTAYYKGKLKGKAPDVKLQGIGKLTNLSSNLAIADQIDFKIKYDSNLEFQDVSVKWKNNRTLMVKDKIVFDRNLKLQTKFFDLKTSNAPLHLALHYFRKSIPFLKGEVTGNATVSYQEDGIDFSFQGGAKNLMLSFSNDGDDFNYAFLDDIQLEGGYHSSLKINASAMHKESKVNLDLDMLRDDFLKMSFSSWDLASSKVFGNKISGVGEVEASFFRDKIIAKGINFHNFSVYDLNLGQIDGNLSYFYNSKQLILENIKGSIQTSDYSVNGSVSFSPEMESRLNVESPQLNYQDFIYLLQDLTPKIKITDALYAVINGKANIIFSINNKTLAITSDVSISAINYHDLNFDNGKMSVKYENGVLSLSELLFYQNESSVQGDFIFDFKKNSTSLNINFLGLGASEFLPLPNHFQVDGSLIMQGNISNPYIDAVLQVQDINVNGNIFTAPRAVIKRENKELTVNLNLADDLKMTFYLNDNLRNNRPSFIDLKLSCRDIGNLLTILTGKDFKDYHIESRLDGSLYAYWPHRNWQKLTANMEIDRFLINQDRFGLAYNGDTTVARIEQGKIKKLQIPLIGENDNINILGNGDLSKRFKITSSFLIDSSVLSFFVSKILSSDGNLIGSYNLIGNNGKIRSSLDISGQDIMLNVSGIPSAITAINFNATKVGDTLTLNKFNGIYSGGNISVNGNIYLTNQFPTVKLSFLLNQIQFPLLNNSTINLSANGEYLGDYPYNLKGSVVVHSAHLREGIESFFNAKNAYLDSYASYIPKKMDGIFLLQDSNIDLTIDLGNNFAIENDYLNVAIGGNLELQGNYANPIMLGDISTKGRSRIFIRDSEFLIDEGRLSFRGKETPEAVLVAKGILDSYDLRMEANGRVNNLNINFQSRPELTQNDIISLILFGMTQETAVDIGDRDRQFMTSINLGNLLMQRLPIGQEFTRRFGVKINVYSDLNREDAPMVNITEGDRKLQKIKTNTKLKVKKEISDDLDLSLISTIGGTGDAQQQFLINYNLKNQTYLQGVYEIYSYRETNISSVSTGLDLIFRWQFK